MRCRSQTNTNEIYKYQIKVFHYIQLISYSNIFKAHNRILFLIGQIESAQKRFNDSTYEIKWNSQKPTEQQANRGDVNFQVSLDVSLKFFLKFVDIT